jgi:hypothetical protein
VLISSKRKRLAAWSSLLLLLSALLVSAPALSGGGVILRGDSCIIEIGFYDANFTAYQPKTSGNEEFCENLPDTGETIFVLDYLHASLREVPVDFRIVRDTTGLGEFVQHEDILALDNLDDITVYYEPPVIKPGGSFRIEHAFLKNGDYVGVVTAGHPSNDSLYNAVFPFTVGAVRYPYWLIAVIVGLLMLLLLRQAVKSKSGKDA